MDELGFLLEGREYEIGPGDPPIVEKVSEFVRELRELASKEEILPMAVVAGRKKFILFPNLNDAMRSVATKVALTRLLQDIGRQVEATYFLLISETWGATLAPGQTRDDLPESLKDAPERVEQLVVVQEDEHGRVVTASLISYPDGPEGRRVLGEPEAI